MKSFFLVGWVREDSGANKRMGRRGILQFGKEYALLSVIGTFWGQIECSVLLLSPFCLEFPKKSRF